MQATIDRAAWTNLWSRLGGDEPETNPGDQDGEALEIPSEETTGSAGVEEEGDDGEDDEEGEDEEDEEDEDEDEEEAGGDNPEEGAGAEADERELVLI